MTTASTGVAAVVTPTLVKVLAGSLVELDAWGLVKSTLQVVMGPVGLGLLINRCVPSTKIATVQPEARPTALLDLHAGFRWLFFRILACSAPLKAANPAAASLACMS
jgi:predicted Na+-dependent transporter